MWLRTFASMLLCCLLGGCYVMQAATGQLEVMRRSQPIERVLADPSTSETIRAGLERVVEARAFAGHELGLPASKSFRNYADLGRPYVVWNVVATPEFSVDPARWCFPVAGCVAYRGYFDEDSARSMAAKLASRGDDVTVGGVGTYSTLGHLPDPVFGSMLAWRETRLVGTIFHELAHEQLYVPGDSEFNEAFASVIEEEGVRRWLLAEGRQADLAAFDLAAEREGEFAQLLREARGKLADLYASGLPSEEMRIEKQREFGRLKFAYEGLRKQWGGYAGYDAWFSRSLNNAMLASVATYRDCMPALRLELERAGSLAAFYAQARTIADLTPAQRHVAYCQGPGAGSTTAAAGRQ
jgi:predicted aminopeptidase